MRPWNSLFPSPFHIIMTLCVCVCVCVCCRQYYQSLYGACELVHSKSHKTSTCWHYIVVLKFQLPAVANKIKQK